MFKNIPEFNITTTEYNSKKKWRLQDEAEGLSFHAGTKSDAPFDPETSPKNTNGSYTRTIYEIIRHKYYREQGNPYQSFGVLNQSEIDTSGFPRENGASIYVLKISSQLFGKRINPGSFRIETRPDSQKTLTATDDGKGNLFSVRSEEQIGNIFYPHGIAVLTSPPTATFGISESEFQFYVNQSETEDGLTQEEREEFLQKVSPFGITQSEVNSFLNKGEDFPFEREQPRYTAFPDYEKGLYDLLFQTFTLEFESIVTNYENEIAARIEPDEFRSTTNPTAREEQGVPIEAFEDGDFDPYVTTLGLYNDEKQLVATGKLSKPIKLADSTPMTILARFDT